MESFRWHFRNCLRLKNICFLAFCGHRFAWIEYYFFNRLYSYHGIPHKLHFLEPDVQLAFALRAQNLHKIACLDAFAGLLPNLLHNLLWFREQLAALGKQ